MAKRIGRFLQIFFGCHARPDLCAVYGRIGRYVNRHSCCHLLWLSKLLDCMSYDDSIGSGRIYTKADSI